MKRLTEKIVLSGLMTAWLRATLPTRRSSVFGLMATTEGTSSPPSAEGITVGLPPSITVTDRVGRAEVNAD